MKRYSLTSLLLCFMLFFLSCNKESITEQSFEKSHQNLNEAIMSLKTPDARKTTFADQLSNEEKIYFLESRLN